MSFQGNQREVDYLVGHEIPGADNGAQVVQLTQLQIAQIVSNAVSHAQTHQIQQFQTPIKFDEPAFEGDRTASWLTWSQRVSYQARANGFEDELTAAEGVGLSVRADVFDSSNMEPVRLQNAHVAWMTLINSCSGNKSKSCNVATHRTTREETSNHTIEPREVGRCFVYPMRSTGKRWNQESFNDWGGGGDVTTLSPFWEGTAQK